MPSLVARKDFDAQTLEIPNTVSALKTLTDVNDLGQDFETLALMGTQFESALISTRNSAALLVDVGGYGALQGCDRPFALSKRRINLRFCRSAGLSLMRSESNPDVRLKAALLAVDCAGQIHHSAQVDELQDQLVARSVVPDPMDPFAASTGPTENQQVVNKGIVSLSAIRKARSNWAYMDAGSHMNDVMHHSGLHRSGYLPHVGKGQAWRINTEVLPSFVEFLHDQDISFARSVVSLGLLQTKVGRIDNFQRGDRLVTCESKGSVFAVDFAGVRDAWVIASRNHWQIEMYDFEGRAIAVLAQDPNTCASEWRGFLAAFPAIC